MKDDPNPCGYISQHTYYMEYFPERIKRIPASEKDKEKMPNILYWVQYGDGKPVAWTGPPITAKEEREQIIKRVKRKKEREDLAATRRDIRDGKQAKIDSFFERF